jgi:hypothetical protein
LIIEYQKESLILIFDVKLVFPSIASEGPEREEKLIPPRKSIRKVENDDIGSTSCAKMLLLKTTQNQTTNIFINGTSFICKHSI